MKETKDYLKRRIKYAKKRLEEIKERHGNDPNNKFNYYGGEDIGYWKGLLAGYENVLDKINELE